MPNTHDAPDAVVAFTGGRLITGHSEAAIEGATVIIEQGKIRSVGDVTSVQVTPNMQVIDITGKTIMPGLIDAHVHGGNIEVAMDRTARLPPAVYVHLAGRNLETALNLGFTTLRDAGGLDWGFRSAIEQGLINGPRLLLSVNPLTPTGGHFDERGAIGDAIQPRNSIGVYPEICDGIDQVLQAARQVLRRGADQIKVAADGGITSPSDQPGFWQFSMAELKAAVEVAEAAGKYVMAHAYGSKAIQQCISAGVRSIEHGNLMDTETAALMAENGTYYVPTLSAYDVLSNEGRHELDELSAKKLKSVRDVALDALRYAYHEGVRIGSGSDIIGPYQHLKGRELALKAEVMSPMEVIISATRINAEMMGLSNEIGTLAEGKTADVIVVDGNPLEDLTVFENGMDTVVIVMREGKMVKNHLEPNRTLA